MHIGQRIKALMDARGLSTADMAKHCEITPGAVSNWFATGRISKPNLLKAAGLLHVDVADLISGAVGERGTEPPLVLTDEERDVVLALRAQRAARAPTEPPPEGRAPRAPRRQAPTRKWVKRSQPEQPMRGGGRPGDPPNGKGHGRK